MAAQPSVAFPFKGSDGTTYTGQTVPLDADGFVPQSAADGKIVSIGARADVPYTDKTLAAPGGVIGLLKGVFGVLANLLAVDTVVKFTSTSRSGAISAGGTAQAWMAANTQRRGFIIQNQSNGPLWYNGLAAAAMDNTSYRVDAGETYETPVHHIGTGAIAIIGATTGQAFYAREF